MHDFEIEPERYELSEDTPYQFRVGRRTFLQSVAAGVVVVITVRNAPLLAELPDGPPQQVPNDIGAWLHIAEDGRVTVYTGKVEVGQDIRTSLTQAVAEELHVRPAAIELVMGDTDLTPYDAGTFGSRSTPQMGTQLRRAAAAARQLLRQRAAERWQVPVDQVELVDGLLMQKGTRRSVRIGEITRGQKLVESLSANAEATSPNQWKVAGQSLAKVRGADIVTGRHRFTTDLKLPGMLIGKVLRAPAVGSTLVKADTGAAAAVRGVVVVSDGTFVGVAAPDEMTATRALALIRAEWQSTPQPGQAELFEHLKRTANAARPNVQGSLEQGFAEGEARIEATYTTAYIAHVPLEPRAAVAQWENGKVTVWTGTQRPFGVRDELMRAFRLTQDRVRVIVPDTGSAYGGKHTGEAAIEAARLAQAAGKPVKLVWTREEEFSWAYFRPAALIEVKAAARRNGTITAWQFTNYNAGTAGLATPYNVAHHSSEFKPSETPLRQGSYRALAASANNFAREAAMDELAERIGMDPLAFRLKNLTNERLRNVLNAAASKFGWSDWKRTSGRGIGIACGTEKGGYVACCAEVQVHQPSGRVEVLRIVEAFECGAIVNPDGVRNQIEGSVVMGLGGALWEAIEFENGRILNGRLSQYRVPRHNDIPPIEIVLLDRRDLPSAGAGEAPIIPVAPALAGAMWMATGTRRRELPLVG